MERADRIALRMRPPVSSYPNAKLVQLIPSAAMPAVRGCVWMVRRDGGMEGRRVRRMEGEKDGSGGYV